MGFCLSSQILHMLLITTNFMIISLRSSSHFFIAAVDAAEKYNINAYGLQKLYLMEENVGGSNEQRIEKVSGEDEHEEKETLMVQKFRALLGLKSFKRRNPSSEYVSLSPFSSPSMEAEAPFPTAPAPAPALPIHLHSPPRLHHSHPTHPLHKIQKEHGDKGRLKSILIAILVPAGAAFIVCVPGLVWFFGNFRKREHKMSAAYGKKRRKRGKSKNVSSQKSANKVSLNPGLDLLYLNSLGRDLEQQPSYIKQTPETERTASNHSTPKCILPDRVESNQELIVKLESDNASSSSTKEIMSVHEDVESVKYDSDAGNSVSMDKIIFTECHSSDDETFHSFVDSHSSIRLSNASAGSLSNISEASPSKVPSTTPGPLPPENLNIPSDHHSASDLHCQPRFSESPNGCEEKVLTVTSTSGWDNKFTAQPPSPPQPPPAPPPPLAPVTSLRSPWASSLATRSNSKSSPPVLPNLTSPRKSDTSSVSNQTLGNPLPSPQYSPKPLQAPSSIPAPPCPPPFLKGSTSSAKGPAAHPSQLPQYTPTGKDGTPLPKLKPLHWDKVRAAPDSNMVWDKIRPNSFELDEEMIESLFGYNLQCSTKNDEAKSKSPSPSKHVLDPKRVQNMTILLKAINAPPEQVSDALIRGDGLCLQQLEALVKMVPTKEEEGKLFGYKGDINELGAAEKLVKLMLSIPFAFLRAEAMLYRESFEDEVVHLRNSFSMLEEACKELRSSRLFLKLLEAVLKTGNRMNVGTIRGGARAFKLDTLLKLADVKGTDGKTTLLHFVVQEIIRSEGIRVSDSIMGKINQKNKTKTIEEKEEDYRRMGLDLVSGLSTELYNVKKTATIDLDVLASSVSNLSEGMTKLQHLVHKELSMDGKSGNFVHSMKAFLNYAERNLEQLKEDEDRVLLHVREITEYFHGDVSKDEANPLRIFVIVRDFLGMLDHICKELRSHKVTSSPNPLAPFR